MKSLFIFSSIWYFWGSRLKAKCVQLFDILYIQLVIALLDKIPIIGPLLVFIYSKFIVRVPWLTDESFLIILGRRAKTKLTTIKNLDKYISILSLFIAGYVIVRKVFYKSPKPQGTVPTAPIVLDNERPDVWCKDHFTLTPMDVSPFTSSWASMEFTQICKKISTNCALFHFSTGDTIRAFNISGHTWIFPLHAWKNQACQLSIVRNVTGQGVTSNMVIDLEPINVTCDANNDLGIIDLFQFPPGKNLIDLFCKDSVLSRMNGMMISREIGGDIKYRTLDCLQQIKDYSHDAFPTKFNMWAGYPNEITKEGDCGSIYVGNTPRGPVILGMHVFCNGKTVSSRAITYELIQTIMSEKMNVSGGAYFAEKDLETVGSLHYKSNVRFIQSGVANVYGSFTGFRCKPRSNVENTPKCAEICEAFNIKVTHTKPVMEGWLPWNTALEEMSKPVKCIPNHKIDNIKRCFLKDITDRLTVDDYRIVAKLDLFTAINGCAGITYLDKVNCNTSAGFPYRKSKKFFRVNLEPIAGLSEPFTFTPEILDRVNEMISIYARGGTCAPMFTAHLKDEPVTFAKADIGKTRVFAGAPLEFVISMRMYYLPLVRLIQNNKVIFESCPGTVCQSLEWGFIHSHLTKYGESNMVAGDYKNFDKRMAAIAILAAFWILIEIARKSGNYDEEDLQVMWGMANDVAYPTIDFNGTMMQLFGSNPSGHPLTVIINGLVNSIYIRLSYLDVTGKPVETFQDYVALMTYGDDNVMGVRRDQLDFGHTQIQTALANYGIVYTMADKGAASQQYINIKDVSFLKRNWVWNDEVCAYLCPLDINSIHKMLTTWVKSKTICEAEQFTAICCSATREMFYHGREKYDTFVPKLKKIVESDVHLLPWINDTTFPTFEDMINQFWSNSDSLFNLERLKNDFVRNNLPREISTYMRNHEIK